MRLLARDVDAMLADAKRESIGDAKAIIAPHAGFLYSGPIAASAFAAVSWKDVERVVLVGPSHRVALEGVARPSARAMRTPLGDVAVDHEALDRAGVAKNDAAHAREHSLEVELPFLQRLAPRACVCPIACGRASAEEVANVIDALSAGEHTRVVVSSDLSHYLSYDEGRDKDARTAEKITRLDAGIDGDEACGYVGLRGLLLVAKRRGLACRVLDLRSSGDTRGPRAEVVGYGAFAFSFAAKVVTS